MAYVNVRVLRCLKEELAWVIDKWLWVISNKMLFKTVVPLRKRANMILIFKKAETSDPGNYWPISLTSTVCKVLESIIRESFIEHMT